MECRLTCDSISGKMHRASAHNLGIFNAEVVHGLQVKGIREVGVSHIGKHSKSAEVVYGLQVKGVREEGHQPPPFPIPFIFSPSPP